MTDVILCPICHSSAWREVFQVKDHSISQETFTLKKCNGCTLLVTSPHPPLTDLPKYYQSEDYISHSGKSTTLVNRAYLIARHYALQKKLHLINSLQPKGSALDFGCGTGEFLWALKNNGWKVSGVEPSTVAREKAERLAAEPISETIDSVSGTFDVITLWHVLEHLPDLDAFMPKLYAKLGPHGTLIIAVPNHESADAVQYGPYWAGYDVPRHLWHFTRTTMVLLLQKYGFKLTNTKPMKLDAFYVAALSEKYKHGRTTMGNLTAAFFSGMSSNRKASSTGAYSSLIYIASR